MMNKIELIGCYRSETPDFVVMVMERKGNKTVIEYTVDGITEEVDISIDDFVKKGIDIKLWEWKSDNELIEIIDTEDIGAWDKLWDDIDSNVIDNVWN